MHSKNKRLRRLAMQACLPLLLFAAGCRSSMEWRKQADETAKENLESVQNSIIGHTETITVESAEDTLRRRLLLDQNLPMADDASLGIRDIKDTERWKNAKHLREGEKYENSFDTTKPIAISLTDAVLIAAKNSREFQSRKDALFQAALALDLAEHNFQETFRGRLSSTFQSTHDGRRRNNGIANNATAGIARTFKNGTELAASISVDLVKMLTGAKGSSWGIMGDASISIPLLRGAGEFVVAEPLTQAQRNLVYEVRDFEQYKRRFVVSIASSYLNILLASQRIVNQEENYKRVVTSTRRSRRMADSGLLPENQFDQAVQNELSARDNWISAKQNYQTQLDSFKILIGLPPDALIEPMSDSLVKLQESGKSLGGEGDISDYMNGKTPSADAPVELKEPDPKNAGPNEIDERKAIAIALRERPDLQNALDKIQDAQRAVLIAEDSLRAELNIGGRMSVGEGRSLGQADQDDGNFRVSRASYSAPITFDLPWERTRERNNYRNSLITLERTVRSFQESEDTIKRDIRSRLRNLLENRSSVVIQRQAVKLAERRVDSTGILLQAGRAEMRDVLEAQSALLSAQNSMISALVSYRLNELELQRDLGVLNVTVDGAWLEKDLSAFED